MATAQGERFRQMRQWIIGARDAFEKHRTGTYNVSRKLSEKTKIAAEQSYLTVLPEFEGENIIEWVEIKIQEHQQEAQKLGIQPRPVRIVDIGYGEGQALLDMARQWGEKVQLIGYGDRTISEESFEYNTPYSKAHELQEAGIQQIEGNIIDIDKRLREVYGNNFHPDIVMASFVLRYISLFPQWKIFQRIYRTLAEGGIAFLNDTSTLLLHSGDRDVPASEYLQTKGYSWETQEYYDKTDTSTIAFQRTDNHPRLAPELYVTRVQQDQMKKQRSTNYLAIR